MMPIKNLERLCVQLSVNDCDNIYIELSEQNLSPTLWKFVTNISESNSDSEAPDLSYIYTEFVTLFLC